MRDAIFSIFLLIFCYVFKVPIIVICQSRYFPRHMAAYDKIYRGIKYICGLGKLVTRLLQSFIVHIHMYFGMGRIYKYHIAEGRGRHMTNQMKMKLLNFNFRYVFQTAVN